VSRAVVFDCDGVLVDSEPHSAAAWVTVLGRRGHRGTAADVADCTGLGYAATYEHLAAVDPAVALPSPERCGRRCRPPWRSPSTGGWPCSPTRPPA